MVLTQPIFPPPPDAPLLFVLVALGVYVVPSVVGLITSHQKIRPVLVINLLLGWTAVGWAVSLAMALDRTKLGEKPPELERWQLHRRGRPAATVHEHSDLRDSAADVARAHGPARPCIGQAPKPSAELPRDLSDCADLHGRSG
jgi:hypothetical protein